MPRLLQQWLHPFLAIALVLTAIVRIGITYKNVSQLFDEPCHAAASIELLDRHTYKLDPVHPPLARIAIGIPLYFAGERYPKLSEEAAAADYNVVGNHVLYDSGHYRRNLVLARSAMLPFLVGLSLLVYFWSRREFGQTAGLVALGLLTTTPIILALSSIAYTDLVAATTQFAALFAFTVWLDKPTKRSTLLLGIAAGLALASKLTSLVFVPGAAILITLYRWARSRNRTANHLEWQKLAAALAIAMLVLWASYGFSVGHVREEFSLSVSSMPSFQHFPGPLRAFARSIVIENWKIPLPAFFHGFAEAWVLNKTQQASYMFGNSDQHCWYFFLTGVFFKTPIPLLILGGAGIAFTLSRYRTLTWSTVAPLVAILAIFVTTLPVKYHAGMRHVLVVFPLLAVVAGGGAAYLLRASAPRWMRAGIVLLLAWQGIETVRAQQDFIAYFNEFAGRDPSRVMLTGCDLDCGQDIFRLADDLKTRGVSHFSLAVWSSADMQRMGLPSFDVLHPSTPVTGWIAISSRSQHLGEVLHENYGPAAYIWLEKYQPVAQVGATIRLYYIPTVGASR